MGMNIGVFLPGYSPEIGGGYVFVKEILDSILRLAPKSNHTFTIFTKGAREEFHYKSNAVRIIDLTHPNLNGTTDHDREKPISLQSLQSIAHEMKIEFMWFITPVYLPVDMPYLTIVLDLQHRLQPWFPEVGLDAEWQGREDYYKDFLRRATYILAGTETGREELSFFYQIPKDRIKILPHPTPSLPSSDRKNDDSVIKKHNLPKNFLFYPAQFWAHKNHVNILYAMKFMKDKYELNLPAVFVGSDMGNLSHVKHYAEKLNLADQVYFLGFVSRDELIELYRNAFALIYMSFFGPENLPPLEAFSLGCPVIAAKVQGAEEQFSDAALLVDPSKPEEMAHTVKRLWDDPILRDSLIKKGLSRAPKWTGEDFVNKVFSIFDDFEVVRRCWPT